MSEKRYNLENLISLIIVMATVIGTTVPLYLHTDSKIDAIQKEISDFHRRLIEIELNRSRG